MSTLHRYFFITIVGLVTALFFSSALPVRAQESGTVYLPLLRSTEEEDGGRQFAAAGDVEVEYTGRDDIPSEVWPALASIIEREAVGFTERKFFIPSAIDHMDGNWVAGVIVVPESKAWTTLVGLPRFTIIMTQDINGWYGHTEFDPGYADLLTQIPGGYIGGFNTTVRPASSNSINAIDHKFPWRNGDKWTVTQTLHDNGYDVDNNIDFAPTGSSGDAVLASARGRLYTSCEYSWDTQQVAFAIIHDDGTLSEYLHIDKSTAKLNLTNKTIPRGTYLGDIYRAYDFTSACGKLSGPHLHFGLSDTGAKVEGTSIASFSSRGIYESTNTLQECEESNPDDNEVILFRERNYGGGCKVIELDRRNDSITREVAKLSELDNGNGRDVNSIKIGDDVMAKLEGNRTGYCLNDDGNLEDSNGCADFSRVEKVTVYWKDDEDPEVKEIGLDSAKDGYLLTQSTNIRLELEVSSDTERVRITAKWPDGEQQREFNDDDDWESTDWNLCNRLSGNHEVEFEVKMWDKVGNDATERPRLRIIYPDLRRDCKIDILDLIELIKVVFPFGGTPAGIGIDVNNDGKVDILDIVALIMLIFGDAAAASMADGGDAGINASGLDNASQMQGFIELGSILPSESSPNYYREIRASTVRDSKLYLLEGTRNTLNDYIHINVIDVSELANPISTPISLTKSIVSESVRALWTSDITVSGADNGDGELIQVAAPLISPFTDPPNSSHVYAQSTGNSWESWSTSNFDYDDRLVREVAEYALLSSPNGENGYYEITAWPGTSGEMTYRTDLKLRGLRIVPDNPDPYIMAIEGGDRVWIAVASAFDFAVTRGEGVLGSNMVDMDVVDLLADQPPSDPYQRTELLYAFADTEEGLVVATDSFANVTFVPIDGQATQVALAGQHVFLGTLEGTVYQFNIGAVADGGEPLMLAKATGLGEIINLSVEGDRLYVTTPDLVHVLGINGSTYPVHEINSDTVGSGSVSSSSSINAYYDRELVTLTAVPDEGWRFVRWEGDLNGEEPEQTFEIRQSMDVTAVFEQIVYAEYEVDVIVIGSGSATISPQQETYREGESVYLSAVAEPGWRFTHWRLFYGENEREVAESSFEAGVVAPMTALAYFEVEVPDNPIQLGDVNCDGRVSTRDATNILRFDAGYLNAHTSCDIQSGQIFFSACDVNGDGNCTTRDATTILRCDAGYKNDFCP